MFGLMVTGMMLFVQGCASDANKRLDQKIGHEPPVKNTSELNKEIQTTIDQDSSLTPDQKEKLTKLRKETAQKLLALRQESLKLRDILIRDFESENDEEIDLIHERMKDLNDQQVSVLFHSVREGNKILGHVPFRKGWIDGMITEGHARSSDLY